jgi:anti-sigma factor RsiW
MKPCADQLPLLIDRAAGALSPADAARLEPHLAACPACRAEAAGLAETLALAALPPPSRAEVAALDGLADRIRSAQQVAAEGRRLPARVAVALLAVAAAVAFLLAPAFARRAPRLDPAEVAVAEWESPDPAELWSASEPAFDDGAVAMAGADEVALEVFLSDEP